MARRTRLSIETLESRQLLAADLAPQAPVEPPPPPVAEQFAVEAPEEEILIGLLLPAVQKVREAAARLEDNLPGDLTGGEGDDEPIGLLLPAVQKVREAAARLEDNLPGDLDSDRGDEEPVALLLPAVQKVRDAAARLEDNLPGDLTGGEGDDEPIGLLLPAIQKVRDAAARMESRNEDYLKIKLTDVLISSMRNQGEGDVVPTDQISLNFSKIEFLDSPDLDRLAEDIAGRQG